MPLPFTHHTTPQSDIIQWSNWRMRWGMTQYLTVLGIAMQALLLGMGTAVLFYWLTGWGWLVWVGLAAVVLGLTWLIMRQLLPLFHKRTLTISANSLTVYDIGTWCTATRHFALPEVQGVVYTQRPHIDWEPMLLLAYRARPFGREQLELLTHYPLAPWLHTADQQILFNLLMEIMEKQ